MAEDIGLLGERIAVQAAHLDAATHRLLVDLREFDARGGWRAQGASSCAHWMAWRVGWDLVTARDRVRVAHKLGEFPAIDDALRRGELSYSKVRALVRIATPANCAMLLEHARLMTASQLETLCRKYAVVQHHDRNPCPVNDEHRRFVRRRDTEDGMVKIEAVLHPEEAEIVWAMLDHAAKQTASGSGPPATPPASPPASDSGPSPSSRAAMTASSPASASAHPRADSAESSAPVALPELASAPPEPSPRRGPLESATAAAAEPVDDQADAAQSGETRHVSLNAARLRSDSEHPRSDGEHPRSDGEHPLDDGHSRRTGGGGPVSGAW